jgi:hypothetical protein
MYEKHHGRSIGGHAVPVERNYQQTRWVAPRAQNRPVSKRGGTRLRFNPQTTTCASSHAANGMISCKGRPWTFADEVHEPRPEERRKHAHSATVTEERVPTVANQLAVLPQFCWAPDPTPSGPRGLTFGVQLAAHLGAKSYQSFGRHLGGRLGPKCSAAQLDANRRFPCRVSCCYAMPTEQ